MRIKLIALNCTLILAIAVFFQACEFIGPLEPAPHMGGGVRTVRYYGSDTILYVKPKMPTQIGFPGEITTHFYDTAALTKAKDRSYLTLLPWGSLPADGELIEVKTNDRRRYRLWVLPAGSRQHDAVVTIEDTRSPSDAYREERRRWR